VLAFGSIAAMLAVVWLLTPVHVPCSECWDAGGSTTRFLAVLTAVRGSGTDDVAALRASGPSGAVEAMRYLLQPPDLRGEALSLAMSPELAEPEHMGDVPAAVSMAALPTAAAEAEADTSVAATGDPLERMAAAVAATAPAVGPPTGADGASSAPGAAPAPSNQKIIKNADMTIEVEDVVIAIGRLEAAAAQLGGYPLDKRFDRSAGGPASAVVALKVPVANFEALLQRVREAGLRVIGEQATGRDATKEYVDLQSQIANLEATQARIREFLGQAENVEEALRVNSQLREIEGELSVLKGQMNFLGQQAAYSTVTVNIQERPSSITPSPTPTLTPTVTPTPLPSPTPVAWLPGKTAGSALGTLSGILTGLADLAIWFAIVLGPFLVPALALWWLWRRRQEKAGGAA
jgi:hypothetical protein